MGDVTFIPGVGVRLDSQTSYIQYQLQQPLHAGEFSLIITNLIPETAGLKTKVFSMSQGEEDITTDHRRFTIEKRGSTEPGHIAWRVITSEESIETIGAERVPVNFQPTQNYLWRATWNTAFNLTIDEGGAGGRRVYDFGKPFAGIYDPNPHFVFLGSPPPRGGPDAQTTPGAVLRQVWVSSRPRPAGAN